MRRRLIWFAGVVLLLTPIAPAAHATATNLVPNPGFEQLGGWVLFPSDGVFMDSDPSNPHSGSSSVSLGWYGSSWGAGAETDPAFCAAIGPGAHPASFWYRDAWSDVGPPSVYLGATFYDGADCSGVASGDSLEATDQAPEGTWEQATGNLIAPPGTESALFSVGVFSFYSSSGGANFDDLEVDDTVSTDVLIRSFTPTNGLVGTSVDIRGANFSGASSVSFNGTAASFTVDSDFEIHAIVPSGATRGPISVVAPNGTATSSSSFTVDRPPNAPPTARFSFTCTALTCSLNGTASSDSDGTIQSYSWNFGDGTSGSGGTTTHAYFPGASARVTLTVTDDDGATDSTSNTITIVTLGARGYKARGHERVDLAWTGPSGTSFDVYRNGSRIATVQAGAYTDDLNTNGHGTYVYKVCAPAISACSNTASVTF